MAKTNVDLLIGAEGAVAPNAARYLNGSMTAAVRELEGRGVARTVARETMRQIAVEGLLATEVKTKTGATVMISKRVPEPLDA